jgi:outer membrane protein
MKMAVAGLVLMAGVLSAGAAEYGRGSLSSGGDGLGRNTLPSPSYDGFFGGGAWGVKASLGWSFVNWELGAAEGSDSTFAPQASVFYKATDNIDVNVSGMFVSGADTDDELGDTEADVARLALGVRYWFDTQTRITPYVGGGIGYYIVDGSTDNTRVKGAVVPASSISVDNSPGAFLEGGVAFQVSDNFFINTEVTYDFLLGSAGATINGEDEDFGVSALTIGLGVTLMF